MNKKYNLFGEYTFGDVKGKQEGIIYLNSENNFVGTLIDTNENFLTCGNLTEDNLKLLKIPKNLNYLPVYWTMNKKNSLFKGDFYFAQFNPQDTSLMFNSLEKTLKSFEKGDFDKIDEITGNLFNGLERMDSFAKEYNNSKGSGTIVLRK